MVRRAALFFFELEHVAHMDEADDVIDGAFVDRDARILLVNDELAQLLERRVGPDGDHVGARRHDFANHFVAELDHGLDELAIVFFDEAFLGAGGDQRVDVFGGRGRFGLRTGSSLVMSASECMKFSSADERAASAARRSAARERGGASHSPLVPRARSCGMT